MNQSATKEKDKIIKFNVSRISLMRAFDEAYDNGDLYGALSLINKHKNMFGSDVAYYTNLIDVCDELGAYSRSLNAWYEYIYQFGVTHDAAEKYEGLATTYANLGMTGESVYYYKKMITSSSFEKFASEFDVDDIDFIRDNVSPLRMAYSRKNPDYSDVINSAVDSLRKGDFDAAISALSSIDENSVDYLAAENLSAISYMLKGDTESGRAICDKLLKKYPGDVQTLTTLAAMYVEQGDKEASKKIAKDLCSRSDVSSDNLYKIATVACENGLTEEALKIFLELERESPADKNILYFIAVASYRTGKYSAARKYFRRILALYPNAKVAEFYSEEAIVAEDAQKYGADYVPIDMPYVYHIPDEARSACIKMLEATLKLPKYLATAHDSKTISCLYWAFDEYNGQDTELQFLAMKVADKCEYNDFIDEMLMRYDVPDGVKITALYMILLRNRDYEFDFVIANIYCNFSFRKMTFGKKKKKKFISCTADLIARNSYFDSKNVEKIISAAEHINATSFISHPELDIDDDSLKCAIYLLSGLSGEKSWSEVVRLFGADISVVLKLLDVDSAIPPEEIKQ